MMMHRATMLAMKAQDVEAHLVQQRATNQGKKAAVTALREARWRWQVAGDATGQVSTAGAGASGDDGLIAATFTQPGSLGLGLLSAAGGGVVVSSVHSGGQAEALGIRPAMRIVRVDGISCDEADTLASSPAIERLRRAGRPVTVHFSPPSESASERPPPPQSSPPSTFAARRPPPPPPPPAAPVNYAPPPPVNYRNLP
jgi:predicted metalloprotease with PDZ domain